MSKPLRSGAVPSVRRPVSPSVSQGGEPVSDDWQPEFDGQRPPFTEGNAVSVRHGAYSERAIAERAEQVHGELLEHAPYLAEPRFIPAVNRYLHAASREALLDEYIQRLSAEKGAGAVPARVWEQATAAARLAAKLGSDLGLDPIGHARIRALSAGAEATLDGLERLRARGAEIMDAREADDGEQG